MNRRGGLALAFLLLCRSAAGAGGFPREVLSSAGRVVSSPARISKADLPAIGAVAAGGLALYSLDGQLRRAFLRNRSRLNDDISKNAEKLGNGGYDAAIVAAYGGLGLLLKDARMQDTSLLAAESFLAANAAGTLLKYSVGRARPYAEDGKRRFTPFRFKTARTSFPSGHTVSAFSLASVFAARSESRAVKTLAYSLASCVALQRVYADKHWSSDVLAGAAIGTAVGRWVAKKGLNGPASAMLLPVYSAGYSGAAAVFSF
ncbi:MAG: phosphatase PAP2 family protein [Elusimicrobiota bacterium]|nr:phosphatase PAP2 family protein [Elusimicrobiota bacterium]